MPPRPSNRAEDSSRLTLTLAVVLIATVAAAYANSLRVPFVLDDRRNIIDNPFIQQLWPLSRAIQAPPQSGVAGRPVISLSLALNYAISGLDVWSYHLFNIAVHIACTLLVFGIISRVLRVLDPVNPSQRDRRYQAFAAALLWALHPIQTMCVTYVIQRAESMMAFFLLLTIYAAIRSATSARRLLWSVVAFISCALGMACKEVMVVAPVLVVVFDRVLFFPTPRAQWQSRRVLYAALASNWLILIALNYSGPRGESAGSGLAGVTGLQYLQTQPLVLLLYVWKSLWPARLCLDYDWSIEHRPLVIAGSATVILVLCAFTTWGIIRRRPIALMGVWFFLILAPTSSLVPISVVASEHRMYLPLASICLALVLTSHWVIRSLRGPHGAPLELGALTIVAITLAIGTWKRNQTYQSALSIWSDVVAQRPANLRARNNLGNELRRASQPAEAIQQYRLAIAIDPNYFDAYYNLAVACLDLNLLQEAFEALKTAVSLRPEDPLAQCILGHVLRRLDRPTEGADHLQRALAVRPNFAKARIELAIALTYSERVDDALPTLESAVKQDPSDTDVLTALAWILATHPDAKKRDSTAAVTLAQRADSLANHADPRALDALAAAYAEAGNFESAITNASQAEMLASAAARTAFAAEIHSRLELYRQSKPFHLP